LLIKNPKILTSVSIIFKVSIYQPFSSNAAHKLGQITFKKDNLTNNMSFYLFSERRYIQIRISSSLVQQKVTNEHHINGVLF